MRTDFLPFSKPSITEADLQAVAGVLRSGWITTGPKCAQFESDFKAFTGCRDAVSMTSETSVMVTLFRALGIGPGDEVISPSMTWVSLPNTAALFGAKVVFVDVDRDTLMVSAKAVEEKITPRTKLIVPVHFAGAVLNLGELREVAARHHVTLVEDAAHALGAEFNGEKIGVRGNCMFSFHPIKNITTGEGGMFATDEIELGNRVRSLKFHGLGVDAYDRQTHGRAPQAQVVEPGYKFNLPDMQAVLGIGQLARLEEMNEKRRQLAMRYREKLASVDELIPLSDPPWKFKHAWHLFVVRVDIDKAGISRDEFMAELKKRNIGTGLHFRCVHLQKYYRETLGHQPGELPSTEWNSDRICSLPLFPDMTERDQDDVIEAAKDIFAHR
ncbi:MAG: UDP-4-amino-4-deoxy-L-arabinose aminotransferase [Lentisphaeria bacterium]|nr:UDP-4-amino-4-deoxy-L-arabinose aminotransferase [Lentisphaeria bacterium]